MLLRLFASNEPGKIYIRLTLGSLWLTEVKNEQENDYEMINSLLCSQWSLISEI